MAAMNDSLEILSRLIAFPSVSSASNYPLVEFVRTVLDGEGVETRMYQADEEGKYNLLCATPGFDQPGVLLSGHSDVVPVTGQDWSREPFNMEVDDGRAYGRGTADMKGFLACSIRAMQQASRNGLRTPLWLAISCDEEVGCIGVRPLLRTMKDEGLLPRFCIVGEPTSMQMALGHKGKTSLEADCKGKAMHTAMAPRAVNAMHLACDLVAEIRALQDDIAMNGRKDSDYVIPYTTLHVAGIDGGVAANIVPDRAKVRFEIRNVASDDPGEIIERLKSATSGILDRYRHLASEAGVELSIVKSYPGLETGKDDPAVNLVSSLLDHEPEFGKVSYGTEGGLFSRELDIPVVICGPGNMEQGHRADEFVTVDQLRMCDRMLDRLQSRLRESG